MPDVAALLHLYHWGSTESRIELSDGIHLCRTLESPVGELYESLCYGKGLDEGEQYEYHTHVVLDAQVKDLGSLNIGDPYSPLDRLCNVISIVTMSPIGMCRIIESRDKFTSCSDTYLAYTYGPQSDFLHEPLQLIDGLTLEEIRKSWQTTCSFWERDKARGRLVNALTYYYYAWRSQYLEQTCINLSVVLELLFAPLTRTEVTHQIAFNVSHFAADTAEKRKYIYEKVKEFYNIRSKIIHGSIPDNEEVVSIAVEAYQLCASILREIIANPSTAECFNGNSSRKEMLSRFVFG